jgi:hypothetical protein
MSSPFPGMNPWLERPGVWEDFHNAFIGYAREHLVQHLQPRYLVRSETRLHLQNPPADERRFLGRPDVGVALIGGPGRAYGVVCSPQSPTAVLEIPDYEVVREQYLSITDREQRRIVTVIEVLSPTNKMPGENRDLYLNKRRYLLNSRTHLVEIDLLRGGRRPDEPAAPAAAYAVVVSRAETFRRLQVWAVGLRERLPCVPVPLLAPDPDFPLDVQDVFRTTFVRGRFDLALYDEPPEPPLEPADAAWATALLASTATPSGV